MEKQKKEIPNILTKFYTWTKWSYYKDYKGNIHICFTKTIKKGIISFEKQILSFEDKEINNLFASFKQNFRKNGIHFDKIDKEHFFRLINFLK